MPRERMTGLISLRLPEDVVERIDQEVARRRARASNWVERTVSRADVIRDGVLMLLTQTEAAEAPAKKSPKKKAAAR